MTPATIDMDELTDNPTRWWDWASIAILLVAVLTVATRLVATEWTGHLEIIQMVALLAVIAGLVLGKSQFSPRVVFIFAVVFGIFVVFWQIGSLYSREVLWSERIPSVLGRLSVVIRQVITRDVVTDSLLFVFLMALLFWTAGAQAGYSLVRHGNGWQSLLISGIILFVIHSFDPLVSRRVRFLAVFIFFTLVLVARTAYLHRFADWRKNRSNLPPH